MKNCNTVAEGTTAKTKCAHSKNSSVSTIEIEVRKYGVIDDLGTIVIKRNSNDAMDHIFNGNINVFGDNNYKVLLNSNVLDCFTEIVCDDGNGDRASILSDLGHCSATVCVDLNVCTNPTRENDHRDVRYETSLFWSSIIEPLKKKDILYRAFFHGGSPYGVFYLINTTHEDGVKELVDALKSASKKCNLDEYDGCIMDLTFFEKGMPIYRIEDGIPFAIALASLG